MAIIIRIGHHEQGLILTQFCLRRGEMKYRLSGPE